MGKEIIDAAHLAQLEAIADAAENVQGDAVVDVAWGDEHWLIRIPIAKWQALGDALDALATEHNG